MVPGWVSGLAVLMALTASVLALVLATIANRRWASRPRPPRSTTTTTPLSATPSVEGESSSVGVVAQVGLPGPATERAVAPVTGPDGHGSAPLDLAEHLASLRAELAALAHRVADAEDRARGVETALDETLGRAGLAQSAAGESLDRANEATAVADAAAAHTAEAVGVATQAAAAATEAAAVAEAAREAATGAGAAAAVAMSTADAAVSSAEAAVAAADTATTAAHAGDATALRHLAIVRYDAFADVGGRLSYSVALLDDTRSGLVLTTLSGKADVRTYVRAISDGVGDGTLTDEEQQAVTAAAAGIPGSQS